MVFSLGLDLSSVLLDPDDHELGRLEGGKTNENVDDPLVDVILGCGLLVAPDIVCFCGCLALEGTLPEEAVHEGADVQPDLGPERLVVRFENHPLGAPEEALLYKESHLANGNVFPL